MLPGVSPRAASARLSRWLLACALPVAALGCQPDLGDCDPTLATQVAYEESGLPAYEGQALLVRSCGNGSFCHSAGIDAADRFGAPIGLPFDVQVVAVDGNVVEADVLRQRRARFRVVQEAASILGSIEIGVMPPPAAPDSSIDRVYQGAPSYARAEGGEALPEITSAAGREILRNWLACGAPVVERGAAREDGVPAVVEEPLFVPPVEPTWPSIFESLVGSRRCATPLCHGGNSRAGYEALVAADAYRGLVGQPARGEDCDGQGTLVVPGDSGASLLLSKLDGTSTCGDAMPLNQIPVRQATVDAVAAWIDCGAPEGPDGCATP